MRKHGKLTLLLLAGAVLSGCGSNYHAFDGKSGYKSSSLSSDRFAIQYYGNRNSSMKDVEVMWHHKARELCKGGAYQHRFLTQKARLTGNKLAMGGGFIPKGESHFLIDGEAECLAPSYARKLNEEKERLLSEDLTADQLISRRTTD